MMNRGGTRRAAVVGAALLAVALAGTALVLAPWLGGHRRPAPPPATPSTCLLYTSPSPRDRQKSRMPSSA